MKYLKQYVRFLEFVNTEVSPVVKPEVDTPAIPRPSRPNVIPTEKPGVADQPLATEKDVYERLLRVTKELNIDIKSLLP